MQTQPPVDLYRYPFLLVDKVVELVPLKSAVGYKNISANEQYFNGHFPERAIMPGVLQVREKAKEKSVQRGPQKIGSAC
jgi:3-hydroxyacyl-[acyl-carrier-protein] dehydratase